MKPTKREAALKRNMLTRQQREKETLEAACRLDDMALDHQAAWRKQEEEEALNRMGCAMFSEQQLDGIQTGFDLGSGEDKTVLIVVQGNKMLLASDDLEEIKTVLKTLQK